MSTPNSKLTTWRLTPGYTSGGRADFESIHILLGHFLRDHTSPSPLPEKDLFGPAGDFVWGHKPILEKVIHAPTDLDTLTAYPALLRHSIAIIEPWEHVRTKWDRESSLHRQLFAPHRQRFSRREPVRLNR